MVYRHLQIVECFPNTMPKDLPDKIQKVKWKKAAKDVETWEHWYERYISKITKNHKEITACYRTLCNSNVGGRCMGQFSNRYKSKQYISMLGGILLEGPILE